MLRLLFRLLFTLVLLAIAWGAGYYYGYRAGTSGESVIRLPSFIGGSRETRDTPPPTGGIERKLRDVVGADAGGFLSDAALTTKIKSKMGLDDHVQARDIHVSTTNGVVTLTGRVQSAAERARAVALARDTRGVKSVVDRLEK